MAKTAKTAKPADRCHGPLHLNFGRSGHQLSSIQEFANLEYRCRFFLTVAARRSEQMTMKGRRNAG